jgi:uncharacterized protein
MPRTISSDDFATVVDRMGERSVQLTAEVDIDRLPEPVRQRIAVMEDGARQRGQRMAQALKAQAPLLNALTQRAMEPRLGAQERVKRLRALGSVWASCVAPVAACQRRCSHCCHIGVAVFASEAQVIGKELGRKPISLEAGHVADLSSYGYGRPCHFLRDGECSIYESRPLACRIQFSLDVDPMLCELIEGTTVPVPYADRRLLEVMTSVAFSTDTLADLREWFPADGDSSRAAAGN